MFKKFLSASTIAFLFMMSQVSYANTSQDWRICDKNEDLSGVWLMYAQEANFKTDSSNPFFYEHQLFAFTEDKKAMNYAQDTQFEEEKFASLLKNILQEENFNKDFSLPFQGVLTISNNDSQVRYSCDYFTADNQRIKSGDIALTVQVGDQIETKYLRKLYDLKVTSSIAQNIY